MPSTRPSTPFPLKPLPDNGYPPGQCAAEGCERASDIIDGTHRFWDEDVPLCDGCYGLRPGPAPLRADPLTRTHQIMLDTLIAIDEEPWKPHESPKPKPKPEPEPELAAIVKPRSFKLFG